MLMMDKKLLFPNTNGENMREKTLAITGSNGFIGSNIIVEAVKHGWGVNAIVRSPKSAEYVKRIWERMK